jgi:uncharacterized protein
VIRPEIILKILLGYPLRITGIHGVSHWGRVLETGLRLAADNGADPAVVEYFAVFHDARREGEGSDPGHGRRGAELAEELKSMLGLTEKQMDLLKYACIHHTDGLTTGSITARTCWDADRLDLWRVGTRPGEPYLCTESALDIDLQKWSERRSVEDFIPNCSHEWLMLLEEQL